MAFAEMILVNKEEYFALKRHAMSHVISHPAKALVPLSKTLEAEQDLQKVILREDLAEDEKRKLLNTHMEEVDLRKKQMNEKDVFSVEHVPAATAAAACTSTTQQQPEIKTKWRSIIIESVPKTQKIRAKGFLNYIEMVPDKLSWNDRGQIVVDDGHRAIEGSNIVDLVNYAVRDALKRKAPRGWTEFVDAIKKTNLPRDTALGKLGQAALTPRAATPVRRKQPWSKVK